MTLIRHMASIVSASKTFALIPKLVNSPYFQEVYEGFQFKARQLGNISCLFEGPNATSNATRQIEIINDLVENNRVQGIALSVIDPISIEFAIAKAVDAGVTVITFDSDAPNSKREDFVGSNNTEIGIFLARGLLQLDPDGYKNGTYGIVSGEAANLKERYEGFLGQMGRSNSKWEQANTSPKYAEDNSNIALQSMQELVQENKIAAFISLGGWPMFNDTGWREFHDKYPNLTYISADALDSQIKQLKQGYSNGLIGQLPFDMGVRSLETLNKHAQGEKSQHAEIMLTNLVTVLRVPIVLPPANYQYNRIEPWQKIFGYILFCICSMLSLGFGLTVLVLRKNKVIVASQPFFLLMICFGTLVLASAIIPLTFDDSFDQPSQKGLEAACMAAPWLFSLGSTIMYSALFSKTWRINKIFRCARNFRRITVQPKDVLTPFIILMVSSVTLLTVWTALDPWVFRRLPQGTETDEWSRVVSTYGACTSVNESNASVICLSLLWCIFVLSLIASCVQAYQARSISIEYSESTYIGVAVVWTLQLLLLATPIVAFATVKPQIVYFTKIIVISLTACPLLLLIFVPKLLAVKDLAKKERMNRINREEKERPQENVSALRS